MCLRSERELVPSLEILNRNISNNVNSPRFRTKLLLTSADLFNKTMFDQRPLLAKTSGDALTPVGWMAAENSCLHFLPQKIPLLLCAVSLPPKSGVPPKTHSSLAPSGIFLIYTASNEPPQTNNTLRNSCPTFGFLSRIFLSLSLWILDEHFPRPSPPSIPTNIHKPFLRFC